MSTESGTSASTEDHVAQRERRILALTKLAAALPAWRLSAAQRDDLELLQTGGYTPLDGYLDSEQAAAVVATNQLPDGTPWPAPVTLTVEEPTASAAAAQGRLALTDDDGTLLAVLTVTDAWERNGGWFLGGPIEHVRVPGRWDFTDLRRSVGQIRAERAAGSGPILAAQPAGNVDARTAARWSRAADALGAGVLLLPAVGADPQRRHVARIRGYRRLLHHLPADARLRLIPSGRHPSGPAAAGLHAAVAANAGATHLLLPDDQDPGAVAALAEVVAALGLEPVEPTRFAVPTDPPAGALHEDVAAEVRRGEPPRAERGFVVLLSGLSGSGKSTVAKVLRARLSEAGDRQVTLLDGDLVRQHLSSELGFSRAHRDLNVRRIGYVASEVARHGGIAICAPIAPYDRIRREVRRMVEDAGGGIVLVHVATPLEVCEQRDVKGLYARARAGELTGFTGVDDPYEPPEDAEVVIDTATLSPSDAAEVIVSRLVADGWYAGG